jgi:hypothetical protein
MLALLIASQARADTWGPAITITGYCACSDGFAVITTSNNQNPDTCGSSHYLILEATATNFEPI